MKEQQRPVSSLLDQVQDLVEKGGDVLSRDEVQQLDKNGRELRQRSVMAHLRASRNGDSESSGSVFSLQLR